MIRDLHVFMLHSMCQVDNFLILNHELEDVGIPDAENVQ